MRNLVSNYLKQTKRRILMHLLFIRYRIDNAMPMLAYVKSSAANILYIHKFKRVSYPPLYIEDPIFETIPFEEEVEQYVCELNDVKVLGSSNIVYAERGLMLFDFLSYNNPNFRITDDGLVKCKGYPIKIGGRYLSHYIKPSCHIEIAIDMVCNYSFNYYHFVMELIARFFLLAKCNIPDDVPLIVDERVKDIPQLNEIMLLFSGKRTTKYLGHNQICEVDRLYYFSSVNQIIPNYVDDQKIIFKDNLFCPDAINYIRRTLLEYAAMDKKSYPKRVYIARKNKGMRSYNEEELIKIALTYGFEIVSPENYSAKEQFKLFSELDVLISPSGAALTNLICCKPKCKVLVLYSQRLDLSIFSSIAGCLNLDLKYLIGQSHDITSLQSSFNIDEKSFKDSIINWLIKN